VYPIFAMSFSGCTVYPFLRGSFLLFFPSSFPAKPPISILRCRVCRSFRASVFRCYRSYRYSPCGFPHRSQFSYRRCHAASTATLILLVSAVPCHVDSISSVVLYLPYDVPTRPLSLRIVRYSLPLRSASVSVIYCYLFYFLIVIVVAWIMDLGFLLLSRAHGARP
jgi:hypothetical protein